MDMVIEVNENNLKEMEYIINNFCEAFRDEASIATLGICLQALIDMKEELEAKLHKAD